MAIGSSYLQDLVVVFGLGLLVVLLFSRLRLPPIVGFLLTGILVGPQGLQLVHDLRNVERLAEVGIVVLLFTIGVEFSLAQLIRTGRTILLGGGLQVLLCGAGGAGVAMLFGLKPGQGVLVGCIVALSSTAIVMRLLSERAESTTPEGRISLGILMFQDLAVVPMMLAIPFLAGKGGDWQGIGLTLAKGAVVIAAVLLLARVLVPRLLHVVVASRSREIFLLSVVVVCLGGAWFTSEAGLSLGLGAFLAGLMISESEYSHHALGAILPFRDAFSSLFFVSIGMLLDVTYVSGHPVPVAVATLAILAGKATIIAALVILLGHHVRIALTTGILLSQIGEFSFLLIYAGANAGMLGGGTHHLLMAATTITMALTPFMVSAAPSVSRWVAGVAAARPVVADEVAELKDHVIVVGYGLNGQNVGRALKYVGVPYVIIEINPQTVRRLRKQGEPIVYGDATQPGMLQHAGVEKARVLVVTVPDAPSARQIVKVAHDLNPRVHLIVRTRFVAEVGELYRLGSKEVVPEEFETSVEVFSLVLRSYMVPRDVVDRVVREIRSEGYEMFRAEREAFRSVEGLQRLLADVELEVYRVGEDSYLVGKSLAEAEIKRRTGALVIAVCRNRVTTPNPPAAWRFEVNDVAVLLGSPEALSGSMEFFRGG